jgi:hypothetical protein
MANGVHHVARTGGCQGGEARFELLAPPLKIYICHCSGCRKRSAAAFGIAVIIRAKSFALTHGAPSAGAVPPTAAARAIATSVPIAARAVGMATARDVTISITGGSLAEPTDVSAAAHLWTAHKLPAMIIPEHAQQHAREPAMG